jgi:hypothetical protein
MIRKLLVVTFSVLMLAAPVLAQAPAPPPGQSPAGQDGFVPASSLPQVEQIPAAPLLVGSYAIFLILMMYYLWTIQRRIAGVEKEMRDLERRQGAQRR